MKKTLLLGIILLMKSVVGSGNSEMDGSDGRLIMPATVNTSDTVVFDLSQAIFSGNQVDIPVSILSDDTIYALDFSLQYNHSNLLYDSIIDHTNYLQAYSFYNSSDSTLRFTSNSFQSYTNDTALVSIRFVMLSGQISSGDLYAVHSYLNGDSCSNKVVNVLATGISGADENLTSVNVFPDPASGMLYIDALQNADAQLMDIQGRTFAENIHLGGGQRTGVNVQDIPSGIYFLKINTNNVTSLKKILICH